MNITTIEIPAEKILAKAATIKKIAYGIAGIGTLASYGTQVTLLLNNEFGMFSYAIPATIDALALGAAMALQIPRLDVVSRRIAGCILMVAVAVSIIANVWEANTGIQAAGHAWPVVAYLLGELLANRVRSYAERLMAAAVTPTIIPAPITAPVQVANPLPTATITRKAPTARRTSHASCTHAATPRDRAVCRAS